MKNRLNNVQSIDIKTIDFSSYVAPITTRTKSHVNLKLSGVARTLALADTRETKKTNKTLCGVFEIRKIYGNYKNNAEFYRMLTNTSIKAAKPQGKAYKLADTNQLYLYVSTIGTKIFKLDYKLDDKRRTLTIGKYPETTLAEARERAAEARKQIARGINPELRGNSATKFHTIALEYCALKEWDEMHKQRRRLELYAFPFIGLADIKAITPPDVLALVRKIESKGTGETAHRTLNVIGQVFRYAVSCGHIGSDVTRDLRGALKPVKGEHFAAITDPDDLKNVYKALSQVPSVITRNALKMAMLTAPRPGELRAMKWEGIDFEKKQWTFTAPKTQYQMIIPLSTQAIEILKELAQYTSFGAYVFSSLRGGDKDRPISDMALLMALQRLEIESTVHGFRSSFRTCCDEILGYPPHLLEQCLGHMVKDTHGRAYNRTKHLQQRIEIMQAWADFLDADCKSA